MVEVKVTGFCEVDLGSNLKRSFPKGWSGDVTREVADEIVAKKAGREKSPEKPKQANKSEKQNG